jgi:hypothetical protein
MSRHARKRRLKAQKKWSAYARSLFSDMAKFIRFLETQQ